MWIRRGMAYCTPPSGLCVALVTLAVWSTPADAQGAPISECPVGLAEDDLPDWCLDLGLPGGSDDSDEGAGRHSDDDGECGWERIPEEDVPQDPTVLEDMFAVSTNGIPPDDEEVIWYEWCPGEAQGWWALQWVPVAEAVTAEDVAEDLYEAVQGRMPDPEVVTDPPAGVDAIINVPVFVTVENWVDELVETRPLGGETVTVRATPQVFLDTGETGVEPYACAGPGRPYDPIGGDLWEQAAAADTCATPYTLRTGVEGRPEEWPSSVTVRWSITWSATSDEDGTFPAVERTVSVPRGVVEARAVVVSGGQ